MRLPTYPLDGPPEMKEWWRALLLQALQDVLNSVRATYDVPVEDVHEVLADLAEWWAPVPADRGPTLVGGSIPLITHAIFQEDEDQ